MRDMSTDVFGGAPEHSSAARIQWRVVPTAADHRRNSQAEAEREFARKLDQARREAYAEGLAAGRQQAEDQFRPAVERLAETLNSLARLRQDLRQQTIQDLVHLAVSIAARVLHREVAVDPDALSGLIQAAYLKIQAREISRVRMHPTLENVVRKVLQQAGAPNNLVLVSDPSLNPAEVFFETAQGTLDGSVETQLREIERGLTDRLER